MDRYAVIGNPISHSQSPFIHQAFARQCEQAIDYTTLLAPLNAFNEHVSVFRTSGGRGLNVTVPFKLDAFALCTQHSQRAKMAGAVNTLSFDGEAGIYGDNTDGSGLVQDLSANLGRQLFGARILVLGAGGAARGALLALLQRQPRALVIANRSPERAQMLVGQFQPFAQTCSLEARRFDGLQGPYDLVINATSASLDKQALALPSRLYASGALAYDMMYAAQATPFLLTAQQDGAEHIADGLGMLVEQAAESFMLWRGIRPHTGPVLWALRKKLQKQGCIDQ